MARATDLHDVVIVGCGPVGATLALLLGRRGLSVAVADIYREVYDRPRAINLDQEALRTLQATGLVDQIVEGCEPHPGTDFLGVDGELIKYIYSASPPYPLDGRRDGKWRLHQQDLIKTADINPQFQ